VTGHSIDFQQLPRACADEEQGPLFSTAKDLKKI